MHKVTECMAMPTVCRFSAILTINVFYTKALLYNTFRWNSCLSIREAAVPIAIATVDVAHDHTSIVCNELQLRTAHSGEG